MLNTIKISHLRSSVISNSYHELKNITFCDISRNFLTFSPEILLKQNSEDVVLAEGKEYRRSTC